MKTKRKTPDAATAVPVLRAARLLAMTDALERSLPGGRVAVKDRDGTNYFGVLLPETMFAAWAGFEFKDAEGPFHGDGRLVDAAVAALDGVSKQFRPTGVVGEGDMNTPYFTLVPFTRALLHLRGRAEAKWHARTVDACRTLFADAAAHINRTHDYLNPRAMEAVSALGLHRLTGDRAYLDRCTECLDQLLTRIYPCGAQPYHTGMWVWGRKPAQGYQFLTASLMLYLGRELHRDDAIQYVRAVMDFSLRATTRRGEAFVTVFEGLHKANSRGCAGRQWPIACALGDERFTGLARAAYEIWVQDALHFGEGPDRKSGRVMPHTGYLTALNDALHMGVRESPAPAVFHPPPGRHVLPDISSVLVHEGTLDAAMTLLTGYSAFAEADCGNVKLVALLPELTEQPTYRNGGTDAMRVDWKTPSEQIECAERGGRTVLRGRVFTKWETNADKDFSRLHCRLLEVTMTYGDGEMVLEYETVRNTQPEPVASRLLFLLAARPADAAPRLRIGQDLDVAPPAAESKETFAVQAPVGAVQFSAPDGSAIEIAPELSLAEKITAERPPHESFAEAKQGPRSYVKRARKPANEGSLRVAFEGESVLDRGRYRIRFLPGRKVTKGP